MDITTAGVVGISYCWYGFGYCTVLLLAVLTDGRWKLAATYCNNIGCHHCGMVLTIGGNLLPHTVTTLDVTTVAWCCRQTQYLLHPAECHQQHCQHHSDSGQQVSSPLCIALEVTAISLPQRFAVDIICYSGLVLVQI